MLVNDSSGVLIAIALGLVLIAQGHYRDAVDHFSKALKIDGNFKEARHNLALVSSRIRESE